VIEQYTITTTPKYNFPQPTVDTTLPKRFLELSINSLKQVHNQTIQLNQHNLQQINTFNFPEYQPTALQLKQQPVHLTPRHQEILVTAVDTSTIKIGETRKGIVIATRGATIWKQNKRYRYSRLGPFIFHVTEDNKKEVYRTLEKAYFNTQYEADHMAAPNLLQMPTRIASLLERWLQAILAKTVDHGLILFDGSLTSGTLDTPVQLMKEILTTARKNRNIVLAFSKNTNLRANGYLITDRLPEKSPPYLLETTGLRPKPPTVLLGNIYVARLNKANIGFRMDVDREIPILYRIEAVEKLLGNDVFNQGYPETLRLAHIMCTFTANEVLAMQHFISRRYGIQLLNRPDMHRLLFGLFGKGEDYA
jgi:hypothetical protein